MGLAKLTDEVSFVLPADKMGYLVERVLGVGEAPAGTTMTLPASTLIKLPCIMQR